MGQLKCYYLYIMMYVPSIVPGMSHVHTASVCEQSVLLVLYICGLNEAYLIETLWHFSHIK